MLSLPVDAKRALALLERVQQKVAHENGTSQDGVAPQVMMDLELLMGLLQNPVLCGILKLEDSLEELNRHLTHHPSLLPSDFDIDTSGQLVLGADVLSIAPNTGGKLSSESSPSKLSASSPDTCPKELAPPKLGVHQSFQLASAKREIISIQVC